MKHLLASAILAHAVSLIAHAEEPNRFIRVDEDDSAARLQTGITRYSKDGKSVDLIGAVHIADRAYYEELNKRFEGYDALLFEMVGGDQIGAKDEAGEKKSPGAAGLQQIYTMVSRFLKLSGQSEVIDYTAANFVHADLTHEEFERMQAERGETVIGFAMATAGEEMAAQPDPAKLMKAMLSGNSNALKLELVHTLGHGGDQISAFAGESVIITDRNQRAMDVLAREVEGGKSNLAIFYGAAHFPDMEKRLLEQGYVRGEHEWLTAWDIPKPQPKVEPPAAEAEEVKEAA
jgi:hypothetical protein